MDVSTVLLQVGAKADPWGTIEVASSALMMAAWMVD